MTDQTGSYDRTARLARDPFATTPEPEPEAAEECPCGGVHDPAEASEPEPDPAPCLRRNAHTPHDTPRGRCPGTAPEFPSEKVEAVPDVAPAPVNLWNAEWPYPELTAADVAALLTAAAEIIRTRGYYPQECQGYADKAGVSICGAVKTAALEREQYADPQGKPQDHYRAATDVAEDLETRLVAVLYMLGQLHSRTGIRDLSDQLAGWELAHFHVGPSPTQAQAVALLEQAAALFGHMADVSAPVTEAPGRM